MHISMILSRGSPGVALLWPVATLVFSLVAPSAFAAVYKCTAKDGSSTYSDMHCDSTAQTIVVTPEPLHSIPAFQGGLNSYRIFDVVGELNAFSGRTIDVPACFIAGASDWGVYQSPGAFEAMQHGACSKLLGVHLVKGAGHSLAEEQPQRVNELLVQFLHQAERK